MPVCTSTDHSQQGTSAHLLGLRSNPASVLQSLKIGYIIRKCLSILRVIPMSSAQALTIPALLALRMLWILNRNGSMALLKSNAEPGQPCNTPEKKIEQVVGRTIMNINSFSAVVVGFEEVDEVNGHFPMS